MTDDKTHHPDLKTIGEQLEALSSFEVRNSNNGYYGGDVRWYEVRRDD